MTAPHDPAERDALDRELERALRDLDTTLDLAYSTVRSEALAARIRSAVDGRSVEDVPSRLESHVVSLETHRAAARRRPRRVTALLVAAAAVVALATGVTLWLHDLGAVSTHRTPAAVSDPGPGVPTHVSSVPPIDINVGAVASDPNLGLVGSLFNTYFSAVNAHDAARAMSVFAPGAAVSATNPTQLAAFGADISTTTDTQIEIRSIAVTAAGLDVRVHFRSKQSPEYGPDGESCTQWQVVYHLVPVGAGFGILNSSADHEAC